MTQLRDAVERQFRTEAPAYGLSASSLSVTYVLNWGGFGNHSFRVSDGRTQLHLKLATSDAARASDEILYFCRAAAVVPRSASTGVTMRNTYPCSSLVGLILLLGAAQACSSVTSSANGSDCMMAPADSALLAGGPLYMECAVDQPAEPLYREIRTPPPSPRSTPPQSGCKRAEVQFVIGIDGRPERDTIKLVGTGDLQLRQDLLASVPQWRYRPAMHDGAVVRQLTRVGHAVAVVVSRGSPPVGPPNCR